MQTTGNKCSETYTDCITSSYNTAMYTMDDVITSGVKTRKADLQKRYSNSCNLAITHNAAYCYFCRKLLDEISNIKRCQNN